MNWTVAPTLDILLAEINQAAPRRDKTSDGAIGDNAHASRSQASDHNPWAPLPGGGVVTARDFDHDPGGGLDCAALAEHLRARGKGGDSRVKYVIFNRRIASTRNNWAWRPYTGVNAHTRHLHLSVAPIPALFNDTTPWGWQAKMAPKPVSKWGSYYTGRVGARTVNRWDCGNDVRVLQAFIGGVVPDGYFGSATETAVRNYQRMRGLTPVDGIAGPITWAPILRDLGL